MNNLPDWNKIRFEIDIEQYFLFKMGILYYYDKYKRAYILENNGNYGDIIRFFYHEKSGVKMYYSIVNQDSGDIIQFIKKRILQNENASPSEINNEIYNYTSISHKSLSKMNFRKQFINDKEYNHGDNSTYQYYGHIILKIDRHIDYLCNYRKFSKTTIASDLFESVFFTYKTNNLYSLAFNITDIDGNIVGINRIQTISNETFNKKWFDKNSKNSIGFTFSNKLKNPQILAIFESIFDAISFHELYLPQSPQYCATNGELSFRKAKLIVEYFNTNKFKKIYLGNDNDLAGSYFNLNIVLGFITSVLNVRKSERYISIEMNFVENDPKLKLVMQFFKKSLSKNELDDTMDLPQSYFTETLSSFENHIYFTISNSIDAIQFYLNLLLRIWDLSEIITIYKPVNKDFNEDLIELKKQKNA